MPGFTQAVFAIGTLLLAALPGRAALAEERMMWGINGHPLASYHGVTLTFQVETMAALGVKSYRVDLQTPEQLPKLEMLVNAAARKGISILPVLTPVVDLKSASKEDIFTVSKRLAMQAAAQLGDKVSVWELGNELESFAIIQPCEMRDDGTQYPCEWGPAGGLYPLDYYGPRWEKVAAVMRGLIAGMKAAGGEYKIAMGTAGWGHIGAFERMKQDKIEWDISVWHAYGEDPEWAFKALAAYGKPIWVTEFNHPKGSVEGEQAQAEGLKKAMARLQELSKFYPVQAAHIYELMDETYWAPDFEAFMGLVKLDPDGKGGWRPGALKPAFKTVQEFIQSNALAGAAIQ
ncbi:glycosyl hydrolase [Phyllobacterium sp. 0TCS1.6C]|uniref:glycosyl hydrolase n=1 Tax=unclassified Phyllobacterium TaxID=2638441 RepID=UPI002264DEE3|nr:MULTISPECIES: glycosyl hydrolase [unclassified Phyllobacterium]MCX8279964.1 glycosyl hydrolase [Phyllobacterium sp. 0TCS1.6C]MCX8296131.1 glycosyl hydrolase [Phyllobacterium sp. 0TCS1.6A]